MTTVASCDSEVFSRASDSGITDTEVEPRDTSFCGHAGNKKRSHVSEHRYWSPNKELVISRFIIDYYKGGLQASEAPDKTCKTMLRLCDEILSKHEMQFSEFVMSILKNGLANHSHEVIGNIAQQVFSDGKVNWGRIVALHSFAGKIAKYCKAKNIDTEALVTSLAEYTSTELGGWIRKNGGWDAFEKKFASKHDDDDKVWNGLAWTLFGLGTAGLIFKFAKS
ncbi:PREDICTED: bcl-2-related protein A1-like [Priapulus caudatus]|uniref:Bcl-2-related protein A1-like n=1 Tax=Priapulus caudatus TaxID=37621 RepID=A0ABM1EDQ4_PRICU|nr:PREDICTED: bcl-2-related protein A1-like [Priapulus caudatus]XP_014670325.1 PREDICTED: bcl-2-related protein A1-like [Priapulus caudatus]